MSCLMKQNKTKGKKKGAEAVKRDWNVECVQNDVFRNFVTRVENVQKEIRSGIMLCHVCLGGGGP